MKNGDLKQKNNGETSLSDTKLGTNYYNTIGNNK